MRSGRSSSISMSIFLAFGPYPLGWVMGLGLLVWVSDECTGIPVYLAQASQTIPGHQVSCREIFPII